MVKPLGVEPKTFALKGHCSTYWAKASKMATRLRIELRYTALETVVLPLNYRVKNGQRCETRTRNPTLPKRARYQLCESPKKNGALFNIYMALSHRFERWLTESKSAVLPLDDERIKNGRRCETRTHSPTLPKRVRYQLRQSPKKWCPV